MLTKNTDRRSAMITGSLILVGTIWGLSSCGSDDPARLIDHVRPSTQVDSGNGGQGSGSDYDRNKDMNNPDYWNDVCAGGACSPGNGGLPDFVPGGGLTIP